MITAARIHRLTEAATLRHTGIPRPDRGRQMAGCRQMAGWRGVLSGLILAASASGASITHAASSGTHARPWNNSLCGSLVECDSSTALAPPSPRRCPGQPECSAHGRCQKDFTCKCDHDFFGRECKHRTRDCTKLQSCGDCQDPANVKFCGWCADGKYCVPKHIHAGLVRKGKACSAWYEDTCPRRPRPANVSSADAVASEVEGDAR